MTESVLHICAGNMFGGVESMLLCLARNQSSRPAFEHRFVCCFEGRFYRELREAGASVEMVPTPRLSRPWQVLASRKALQSSLKLARPSVVIAHSAWTRLVFGSSMASSGASMVAWIHGVPGSFSPLEFLGDFVRPDYVVINSHYTSDQTAGRFKGIPRQVLYCPVPQPPVLLPGERGDLRRALGAQDDDEVLILMAARLDPWKGHEILLESLVRVKTTCRWRCVIVGGPQTQSQSAELSRLQGLAIKLGLSSCVSFLGERNDVERLMQACDVYCQPNLKPEPFGIALVEALYAGIPVVSANSGGAGEIVTSSCGLLLEPGDTAGFARSLEHLIENREARLKLGSEGPARASELCDPVRQISRLNSLLSTFSGSSASR